MYGLYDNDDDKFWGYVGRAPLAPVDDVAFRLGAAYLYDQKGAKARNLAMRTAERAKNTAARVKNMVPAGASATASNWASGAKNNIIKAGKGIADFVRYKTPSMTEAHEFFRTQYGPNAPRTVSAAREMLRRQTPRFHYAPGDPAAFASAKSMFGKVGSGVAKVARGVTGWATTKAAPAVGSALMWPNNFAGNVARALPSVTGGRIHKLAKLGFTKKGGAVAFAAQGLMDGLGSLPDFVRASGGRDALDKAYNEWTWDLTKTVAGRIGWGFGRALNSVMLGLPGMLPGGGYLDSDEYTESDVTTTALQENFMKALEGTASISDAAKLATEYDKQVLTNLRQGKDADGNRLKTVDAKGNVVDMSAEDGAKQVDTIVASRILADNERKLMRSGMYKMSDVNAKSLRTALQSIDDKFNVDAAELENKYATFDSWAPSNQAIRQGMTADEWAKTAMSNLENRWAHRRAELIKTQTYKDMVEANRTDALDAYLRATGESIASEEATRRFNHFWDSSTEAFREQYTREHFTANLIEARREAMAVQGIDGENIEFENQED